MLQGYESPSRPPVHCQNGMVATSHALSTEAALDILQAGGNAMDAAIAACVVQCVVEPGSTGVGGDCFCMYAPGGQTSNIVAFNGSGKAPSGATCDFFASQGISEIPRQSPHACVVPGAVDAWCQLNHDHGSLPLKDVLAPAIGFARDGYEVFPRVSRDWASSVELMKAEPSLAQIFLSEGQPPKAGDRHHQPALAQTLEAIAEGGRAAFYTGPIAEDMVNYLRKLGGLHTLADFAATRGEYVTPISGQFRGFDVYQCPPNGQGVIALLLLNLSLIHI